MERRIDSNNIQIQQEQIHQENSESSPREYPQIKMPHKDFAVPTQVTWTGDAVEVVPLFMYNPATEVDWMPLDDY